MGDVETVSGSIVFGELDIKYDDPKVFGNRQVHKIFNPSDGDIKYEYKSYIRVGGNEEGPQLGRPMGTTAYYVTSSDGHIVYPINHWSTLDQPYKRKMYEGTQNVNPGYWPANMHQIDHSTASFYRIKVVSSPSELVVRRS